MVKIRETFLGTTLHENNQWSKMVCHDLICEEIVRVGIMLNHWDYIYKCSPRESNTNVGICVCSMISVDVHREPCRG